MLNNRIVQFLETNSILAEEQNGFRASRSCLDHIFSLTCLIRQRLSLNLDTFACFIDLKKAFDFINRKLLLFKLLMLGINGKIFYALEEILSETSSCIRINNFYTDKFRVDNGIRQGDSLSTSLFSIYINDLVDMLKNLNVGIEINGTNLCCLLFADDLVILAENVDDLKMLINNLYTWANTWRLSINISKSKIIHFRKTRKSLTEAEFKFGNEILEKVNKYKYLGLVLDEHLKFLNASEELASSGQRALGAIIYKYKEFKDMGFNTYTTLFNSGVLPILDYCCPVWSHIKTSKIEQVQHRAMRVYMGVNRFAPLLGIYGDMGWLPTKYRQMLENIRYWNSLLKMSNNRISKQIFMKDYNSKQMNTWCTFICQMFKTLHLSEYYENLISCDINVAKDAINNLYNDCWKKEARQKPKLRFYNKFKTDPSTEYYLKMHLSPTERYHMSQLRLGILQIAIETGRYRSIPVEQRFCILCNANKIEDEIHILFECPKYDKIRFIWLNKLEISNFDLLNSKDDLLNIVFKFPRITAKYVVDIMKIRKSLLYA